MALLELENLSKEFPGVKALDGVSLKVGAGEVHAICGENGAGKSTLLKILSGIYPHGSYGGELHWQGAPLRLQVPRQAEAVGIALVAQELNLVPGMSLAENLFLGREKGSKWRVDWAEMRREAALALARVGLDEDPLAPAESLSVGKQQLVEIAKALHQNARLLILDEPTAALAEADALRLLSLVEEIAKKGTAVLYVSHRMEEIFRIAGQITVIRDGKSVKSAPASGWSRDSVVAAMVGRELLEEESAAPSPPRQGGAAVLEVRDWRLAKPGQPQKPALNGLAFSLHEGEILGLGGLMGSGRSALLSTLFGDWRAEGQGELRLFGGGWRAAFRSPIEAMRAGLGLASEDRKKMGLVGPASILENLCLSSLRSFSGRSRLGRLDWRAMLRAAEASKGELRIKAPSLEAEVLTLSGGNQQKVVLGRLMMIHPRILLLDEPTRGIDVGAKAEIHRLVRKLAEGGMSVLMASSDLPELLSLSQRLLVFSQGRITGELEKKSFSPEAVMRLATAA